MDSVRRTSYCQMCVVGRPHKAERSIRDQVRRSNGLLVKVRTISVSLLARLRSRRGGTPVSGSQSGVVVRQSVVACEKIHELTLPVIFALTSFAR